MNVPNAVTLARLVVAAAAFVALDRGCAWASFYLFILAAATDYVDGWLARRWQQVTPLGRVLDPFADKVLTCGAMILLLEHQAAREILYGWVVVVIVAREFFVTAVRGVMEAAGHPFPADRLGKWKMVSQCIACAGLISLVAGTRFWWWVTVASTWLALALTVVSGAQYLWKARKVLLTR